MKGGHSYLLLGRNGARDSLLRRHTFLALLQEALLALALADLDKVVFPLAASFVGIDRDLVGLLADLCAEVGTERHGERGEREPERSYGRTLAAVVAAAAEGEEEEEEAIPVLRIHKTLAIVLWKCVCIFVLSNFWEEAMYVCMYVWYACM